MTITRPVIASIVHEFDARPTQENPVVTWEDTSGNANDASAVSTPDWEVNGWRPEDQALGTVRMLTNEYFTYNAAALIGTPLTLFFVVEFTDLSATSVIIGGEHSATDLRNLHVLATPTGQLLFNFYDTGTGNDDVFAPPGTVVAGGRYVITCRHRGSGIDPRILRVNGCQVGENIGTSNLIDYITPQIGRASLPTLATGPDKIVSWYSSHSIAASDAEMYAMEAWLNQEFGEIFENPKPLITNPEIEYDARKLTLDPGDGNPVDLWPNSAFGPNDAFQITADRNPTFRADRWAAGVPSVEFLDSGNFPPDADEGLTYDATVWQGTDLTLFVVAQAIDLTEGAAFVGNAFGATPPRTVGIGIQDDGTVYFGFGDEGTPTFVFTNIFSDPGLVIPGDKVIITARHTDGGAGVSPEGMLLRVNGVQVASVPGFVTDPVPTVQQGELGFTQVGGGFPNFRGKDKLIAWIGGYSIAATNAQILEMEAFLNEIFDVIPPTSLPLVPKPSRVTALWGAGALRDKSPSGLIQTRNTKLAGWMFTMAWSRLNVRNFEHQALRSFLYTAWQRGQIFNVTHPMQPGSGLPPNGLGTGTVAILGAGQAIRSDSIVTNGWPASTQFVVRAGDVITIDGDSGVYMVTATTSSDGTGGAELFITPPLRKVPANGAAIVTTGVVFRATILDRSSLEESSSPQYNQGPAVTFVEALD